MELKNYKILVSDGLAQEGVEILKKFKNFELTINDKTSREELLRIIEQFDGIIVRSATKITPDVIAAGKKLKVIVRAGTGYDNINIEECNKHGIVVLITPLGNSNAVVELTIGLMLNFSTRVLRTFGVIKAGKDGPSLISLIPNANNVSRIATAFCSYQERTNDKGRSLTSQIKALAKASAT